MLRKTIMAAVSAAIVALALAASVVSAQWPTTCVALNDIVEDHLGNDGNVGIYQRAFGDQAEAGCQGDHKSDVQSTFGWALGTFSAQPQQEQPTYWWKTHTITDRVTGLVTHVVTHRMQPYDSNLIGVFDWPSGLGIRFEYNTKPVHEQGGLVMYITGEDLLTRLNDTFKAEYRFDDDLTVESWYSPYSNHHWPFLQGDRAYKFAIRLMEATEVQVRITGYGGRQSVSGGELIPSAQSNQALRDLLRMAGYNPPAAQDQGWPTTCVALNDIVENHLGNQNNVGIYQKVFGDQAEPACQNDHRADVQRVFAWAA